MGIFEYLLGSSDRDHDDAQPPPSKGGARPDVDDGRHKTQAEKDLRRGQGPHDPDGDSLQGEGHTMMLATTREKSSQEGLLERERRHINREDDPHFDPLDKTTGDKIPGADQAPNHEVNRTADNKPD